MVYLNIIDNDGEVVGKDTRENIHKKGLLHKEIHVWFYTPKGELIFQHRSKNKDTFPDLLDATVGGHVDLGENYIDTAIKEVFEETGVKVGEKDLTLITSLRKKAKDKVTGMTNNVIRNIYAYRYNGDIDNLRVEKNDGAGFEKWSIKNLIDGLSEKESEKFIKSMLSEDYLNIYKKILQLIN